MNYKFLHLSLQGLEASVALNIPATGLESLLPVFALNLLASGCKSLLTSFAPCLLLTEVSSEGQYVVLWRHCHVKLGDYIF